MQKQLQSYSIKLQPRLVEQIDELVKVEHLYPSRNEFLREAVRVHLREVRRESIQAKTEELKKKAAKHPKSPLISREEKERIAKEFLKEKGLI